jgi:hypothetical protein
MALRMICVDFRRAGGRCQRAGLRMPRTGPDAGPDHHVSRRGRRRQFVISVAWLPVVHRSFNFDRPGRIH